MTTKKTVASIDIRVVGAGLAGSEAAWQLAQRGWQVELVEMRPDTMTPAHETALPAELVCSNSFRGDNITQAPGVLKRELEMADSIVMRAAAIARVPAGGAFAVDRTILSREIDKALQLPNIKRLGAMVTSVEDDTPTIVATGPLTAQPLAHWLRDLTGAQSMAFYDAIAPIIDRDSIDESVGWWGNRRDPDGDDYYNIPLDKDAYLQFVEALRTAERVGYEDFESEDDLVHFEGCLPVEVMADRGPETLRYGPLKGVGLDDPRTGRWPYAVVQLRKENIAASMLNMVGFQTKMKYGEQQRVFRSLPGMQGAEFVRLGSLHRNTFLRSPQVLAENLSLHQHPKLWIAGQLSGVEGYIESTASGLVAAMSAHASLTNGDFALPPATTAIGSLLRYITHPDVKKFQPMNTNFGLFEGMPGDEDRKRRLRGRARKQALGERALAEFQSWVVPYLCRPNS